MEPAPPTGPEFRFVGRNAPGVAPTWCPYQAGTTCGDLPSDFPQGLDLQKNYTANVSTVGQDKTPSPWGTYDQGGNVVELLDTLAPQPPGYNFLRNWRYYHGGVANAPAYQLERPPPLATTLGMRLSSRHIPGSDSVSVSSETFARRNPRPPTCCSGHLPLTGVALERM